MISYPFESKNIGSSASPVWDRAISAEMERQFNRLTWKNGVFANPDNSFLVTSLGGMRVNVAPGGCHIEGVKGYEASNRQMTLSAPHSSLKRIDRIVLRLDTSDSRRDIELYVKEGTAATNPVPPSVVRQPNYFELCIAEINIPGGASSLTASNITDTRLDNDLCGMVIPAIPFIMDTAELWKQISGSIDLVNAALDGTTAGNLQREINNLKTNKANTSDLSSKASTSSVQSISSRLNAVESFKAGMADYIVETGSNNGWDYEKYRSGKLKATISKSFSTGRFNSSSGGVYYNHGAQQPINLPTQVLSSKDIKVYYSLAEMEGLTFPKVFLNKTQKQISSIQVIRLLGGYDSINVTICLKIEGYWK